MKFPSLAVAFVALSLLAGGCVGPSPSRTPPTPAPSIPLEPMPTTAEESSDVDATDAALEAQLNAEDQAYADEEAMLLKAEADAEAKLK